MNNWQSIIAVSIAGLTLLVFLFRILRPKKRGGCGHDCGCGKKTDVVGRK